MSFTDQFYSLIENKQNNIVQLILEDSQFYNAVDKIGTTLLHYASAHGNVALATYLLSKGCDINAQNLDGDTPLIYAVKEDQGAALRILIAAGADIDIKNRWDQDALRFVFCGLLYPIPRMFRPLFTALKKKYSTEEVAKRLISLDFPLDAAVYCRDAKMIEYMIKCGVPVKRKNSFPLHIAVRLGDIKSVRVLLNYGADVEARDNLGATPLYYCYKYNSVKRNHQRLEILKILLNKGVTLTTCTDHGIFNVSSVFEEGNSEAIRVILQSNIDLNATDSSRGESIMHMIVANENPGIVDELIPYSGKFDFNIRDVCGHKPLHCAARYSNVAMVEFLLNQGAEVDAEALRLAYLDSSKPCSSPEIHDLRDQCGELLLHRNVDPQVIFTSKRVNYITAADVAIREKHFSKLRFPLAELAIREKKGAYIAEFIRSKIDLHLPLKTYYNKCLRLLGKEISGNVSVFKLLTTDRKQMAKYLNNDKLVRKLVRLNHKQKLISVYKYFYSTLKKRLLQASRNKMLRSRAAKFVCNVSANRLGSRCIVTEKMIDYLDQQDLWQLFQL